MNDSEEAMKHFSDTLSSWNALFDRADIPEVLYHYTTFDGLHGILKDNALRATFSRNLNDSSEWEFGKSAVGKYPIPEETSTQLTPPNPFIVPPPTSMFVACFCQDSDLLSMWRSYTNQGGGYCLGFEGSQLATMQRDELQVGDFAARLVKVFYGDTPPARMKSLLECGGHFGATWVLENMVKHDGFAEEKEWRIIVPNPPAALMAFHNSSSGIKASVQLRNQYGDKKLPLRTVVCGPTVRDDTKLVLSWMLERYGFSTVAVKQSGIPYRQ